MSKKIIVTGLLVLGMFTMLITGCYKVTTLVISNEQEVTGPVKFTTDIIPLFSSSCSISGCHNSGGLKPDLSTDKAYNSLTNGNYVNLGTPENSEIFLWLTGKKSTPMPVGASNNPSNINQLVLAWIKQGAQNN